MAAKLVEIADAVKDILNTAVVTTYSGQLTREWDPDLALEDGETSGGTAILRVVVCPRSEERSKLTRKVIGRDFTIDVGIFKRLAGADPKANTDAAFLIGEVLANLLEDTELASATGARLKRVMVLAYIPAHLVQLQNFTAVVTAVYYAVRNQ